MFDSTGGLNRRHLSTILIAFELPVQLCNSFLAVFISHTGFFFVAVSKNYSK